MHQHPFDAPALPNRSSSAGQCCAVDGLTARSITGILPLLEAHGVHDQDRQGERGEQHVGAQCPATVAVAQLPGQHPAESRGFQPAAGDTGGRQEQAGDDGRAAGQVHGAEQRGDPQVPALEQPEPGELVQPGQPAAVPGQPGDRGWQRFQQQQHRQRDREHEHRRSFPGVANGRRLAHTSLTTVMRRPMSRARMLVAVLGAAVVTAGTTAGASGLASASPRPAERILAGSAVPFTSHARPTGAVPGSLRLTVQLWLKPDVAAAQRFAATVSTPGTALFRHYLSPAAYTARFGASAAVARQAESWLRAAGFTGIAADSGRAYVRATAPVSKINAAFRVRLQTYPGSAAAHAASVRLHANNRPVSLPASLAGHVLAVTGLDNAAPIFPMVAAGAAHAAAGQPRGSARPTGPKVPCSHYYGQQMATALPQQFGVTSFPTFVCGYSALQMRSAYHANWVNTGKGQTIALVEQGLTKDMFLTLQDYARANHMPAPSPHRYAELSLGKDTCGDPFNQEEQLDVESSYDMAPGANQLVVGGDSCDTAEEGNQAVYDADIMVLDGASGHPLATVASNSWEG